MASSSATHTGVRFARATSCGGRSCRCYGGPDCRRSGSMTSDILRRHYCWPRAFIARSSRNASGVRRSRSPSTPTATSCRGRARGRLQARCAADANCGTIAAHCINSQRTATISTRPVVRPRLLGFTTISMSRSRRVRVPFPAPDQSNQSSRRFYPLRLADTTG